jgi:thymidylate kinase
LEDGHHVLCAHYLLSSYAQLLDQVPFEWHSQINARCRPPDLTLYIDTSLAQGDKLGANYHRLLEAGLLQSPLTTTEEWSIPDAERHMATPLAFENAHSTDFATTVLEALAAEGQTFRWIDAAGDIEAAHQQCRREIAHLLSLGDT